MEPQEQVHPGKVAMDKIMFDACHADTKHPTAYEAIIYLHERLQAVEKLLAERSRAFTPPTPEEVSAYAAKINFSLDGASFCDYYAARNWCVGKVKMKDWQAAIRTWKTRRLQEIPKRGTAQGSLYADKL